MHHGARDDERRKSLSVGARGRGSARLPGWDGARELAEILIPGAISDRTNRSFRGRAMVEREYERRCWRVARKGARLDDMLTEHLVAGALGGASWGEIRALAIRYDVDDLAGLLEFDLDGRGPVPTEELLYRIGRLIGFDRLQITSGSGRKGRCRGRVLLSRLETIRRIQHVGRQILAAIEAPPGSVETFPSTRPGRLPFGAGGCDRLDFDMSSLGLRAPSILARELLSLPPIDLDELSARLPDVEERRERSIKKNKREKIRTFEPDPRVERWLEKGADPGEKDSATYGLIKYWHDRRVDRDETLVLVDRWLADGGISRCDGGRTKRMVDAERRRLPRRVAKVFETHPLPARPKRLHLTARDIVSIADVLTTRMKRRRVSREAIGMMCARIAAEMKGHARAGMKTIRIGHEQWRDAGGEKYVRLREVAGMFEVSRDYLSERKCRELGIPLKHARSREYLTTTIPFEDGPAPRRALGTTWSEMVRVARKKLANEAKRAAKTPPPEPKTDAPIEIRASFPSARRPRVLASPALSLPRHEESTAKDGHERAAGEVLRGLRNDRDHDAGPVVRPREASRQAEGRRAPPARGDVRRGHGARVENSSGTRGEDERARALRREPDAGSGSGPDVSERRGRAPRDARPARGQGSDPADQAPDLQDPPRRKSVGALNESEEARGILETQPPLSALRSSSPNRTSGKGSGGFLLSSMTADEGRRDENAEGESAFAGISARDRKLRADDQRFETARGASARCDR